MLISDVIYEFCLLFDWYIMECVFGKIGGGWVFFVLVSFLFSGVCVILIDFFSVDIYLNR